MKIRYTEQLLRIIKSVPSPKAEPFKSWLAKVGTGRQVVSPLSAKRFFEAQQPMEELENKGKGNKQEDK